MADIDKFTREAHLLKMLSEDTGLDILEAAFIVQYAGIANCSIADAIITVLNKLKECDEEDNEKECVNSCLKFPKEFVEAMNKIFCCKEPQ